MGQYYRPIVLNKKFKEDTEHSCIASMTSWEHNNGAKLMEHSYVGNNFVNHFSQLIGDESGAYFGYPVVWCGDYADEVNGIDLFSLSESVNVPIDRYDTKVTYKYIVNLTKKQYVVIPDITDDLTIHPLPLLTCSGNGRGGGDYHYGKDLDKVGIWAFDCIGLTNEKPSEEYTELEVAFEEE